jgi:hypothetical protein
LSEKEADYINKNYNYDVALNSMLDILSC